MKKLFCFFIMCTSLFAQDFWKSINTLPGGKIKMLSVDKYKTIYAGTGKGMFKSSDQGDTWTNLSIVIDGQELSNLSIDALMIEDSSIFSVVGRSPVRSTNLGRTWTKMNDLPAYVTSFARNDLGNMVAGTESGLYKSNDKGLTWSEIPENPYIRVSTVTTYHNEFIVGSADGAYIYTTQDGSAWTEEYYQIDSTEIKVFKVDPFGFIYAGTSGGNIYRSELFTNNWVLLTNTGENTSVNDLSVDSSGLIYAGVGQSNPEKYSYPELYGVYSSIDTGESWFQINLSETDVNCISIINGQKAIAGTNKGVYASDSLGINWKESNDGIFATSIYDVVADSSGGIWIITDDGLKYSSDDGNSWTDRNNGISGIHILLLKTSIRKNLYVSTSNGLFFWKDNQLWEHINDPFSKSSIKDIVEDNNGYLYVTNYNIGYRSTDLGNSWTELDIFTNFIYSFFAYKNLVFTSTIDGLYKSINNGDTWEYLTGGRAYELAVFNEVLILNNFSSMHDNILISADEGDTWDTLFEDARFSAIVNDMYGNIYLSLSAWEGDNVLKSNDTAKTWTPITEGLPLPYANALCISKKGYLFALLNTYGLFRSIHSTDSTNVNVTSGNIIKSFVLHQNYPNPFNPVTNISFALPAATDVTLKVYDVLGNEIVSLLDDFKQAGTYTIQFEGTNLSSGIYFYKIQAGEFSATKKLVLMK